MQKPILQILLVLLFLSGPVCADEVAPPFNLTDTYGRELRLSALQGKVVYLDFWASWCSPCAASFPWMKAMQERYADQGLKIVAINLDQERTAAEEFLDKTRPNFTVLYDTDGTVAQAYGLKVMPSSYLIDRHGRVQFSHSGFRLDQRHKLEQRLQQALTAEGGVE